jgi:hypothetical protein
MSIPKNSIDLQLCDKNEKEGFAERQN